MNFIYPKTVGEAFSAAIRMFSENHRVATVWKLSVATLLIAASFVFYMLLTEGHAAYNTSSDGITWGLQIVTYAFFVLTSTGLTFVASMAMVFGNKAYYPIAKRCIWLAVITLIAGFSSLGLELGHPERMPWAIPTGMQITSPMFWMGNFYGAYMVFLLLKFRKVAMDDWGSPLSKALGVTSFVIVVIAHGTLGGIFGSSFMRPMWYGPMIPLYFLATAALSGTVFAIAVTYLAYGNEQAMPENVRSLMRGPILTGFKTVLGIIILATISRMVIGLWSNADGLQVWAHLVRSPVAWVDNILMLVAMAMLLAGSGPLVPALLVIVTLCAGRYEFVISGQLLPLFKGMWVPGLIDYMPSLTEWGVVLMCTAIVFAGWAFGERTFNLGATPHD